MGMLFATNVLIVSAFMVPAAIPRVSPARCGVVSLRNIKDKGRTIRCQAGEVTAQKQVTFECRLMCLQTPAYLFKHISTDNMKAH